MTKTNMENSIHEIPPCVLIEGPRIGDAAFYGEWLLAAAKADGLWKEAFTCKSFQSQVRRLTIAYLPDFGIAASRMLCQLLKDFVSGVIPLDEGLDQQELVMMVELGFFELTGQRYQMVIPTRLGIDMLKKAALRFAHTMDVVQDPEYLVATMPYTQAKEWQKRLRDMDRNQRCADRALLLSGSASCSINP
jgi:hypothetical protein